MSVHATIERMRAGMVGASVAQGLSGQDIPAATAAIITRQGIILIVSVQDGRAHVAALSPYGAVKEGARLLWFATLALWRGRRWRWDR
jgi:hypothetical protein